MHFVAKGDGAIKVVELDQIGQYVYVRLDGQPVVRFEGEQMIVGKSLLSDQIIEVVLE